MRTSRVDVAAFEPLFEHTVCEEKHFSALLVSRVQLA